MFALNSGAWPVALQDPAETRDQYHRIAMREAQIVAEQDPHAGVAVTPTLMNRVRSAIGLTSSEPDCVPCGA
jgi:hypothetical protein